MPTPVELVLVDDHPLFTRGMEILLQRASGGRLTVVGTTDDAAAAAGLVRRSRPDLVLVDLAMPPPGGVRAIAAVRRTEPGVPVVALSGTEDFDLIVAAFRAGASAFLPKSAEPADLVGPLLSVTEGWSVLPPTLLARLAGASAPAVRPAVPLTAEQRRLWLRLAEGATTVEMASELNVSERTAKRMIAYLLRRLGVTTRSEAAALAGRSGLLDPERG
jgi:two-component system, NarL family, nitrate/nitrite response regulator NarL